MAFKQDVTMKGLREYGRIKSIFVRYCDDDFDELDDKALLNVADEMIIRIKGTEYCVEVTAVIEPTEKDSNIARARLHFRKCVDV